MSKTAHVCADNLERISRVRDFPIHGTLVSVPEELYQCGVCGEEEYSFEQALAAERRAGELYRGQNGFLQPDEIAAMRRRWGITQAQMENALGVGRKTVARWEAGRVLQSRALDNLLRAIDRFPDVLGFLADRQGVQVTPDADWAGAGEQPAPSLAVPRSLLARLEHEAGEEGVNVNVYAAAVLAQGLERRSANREAAALSRRLDEALASAAEWQTGALRIETEEPWLRDHKQQQRNGGDKAFAL